MKSLYNIPLLPYIILLAFLLSCNPARKLPENKYLLEEYEIEIRNNDLDKKALRKYIQQSPNKKIFGFKFYLWLYNLAKTEKDNWWNNWLKKIGEEPAIYDPYSVQKTKEQFQLFLKNKGYYHATVRDTTMIKKRKAIVKYSITANKPLIIKEINYNIKDTALNRVIFKDTTNRLIQKYHPLDIDLLEQERKRIADVLKNNGYFAFTKEYVNYMVDSTLQGDFAELTLEINKFDFKRRNGESVPLHHKIYKINNIYVFPQFSQKTSNPELIQSIQYDTLPYKNLTFIYQNELNINKEILNQSIYIEKDSLYEENEVKQTYKHLNSIDLYKIVNVQFNQVLSEQDFIASDTAYLNCLVQLTPAASQSYSIELEGTNSSGNLGGATSLSYGHKNIFSGFEVFNLRLRGAFETLKRANSPEFSNTIELGTEARFEVQKFLLPLKTEQFIKKFNPNTNLSFAYNYQQRPDYTRTIANMKFGYQWEAGQFFTHFVNPVEFNIVTLPYRTQTFIDAIEDTYLEYSYQPHLVSVSSYRITFNNQSLKKRDNFIFVRLNAESAGNIISGIKSFTQKNKDIGNYKLFNTQYAQFVKSDIDVRFYQILNPENNLAYRIFLGIGHPYGNSNAMPFEKKYFAGGANSIRAWQIRTLGPGSVKRQENISAFPNQTGDIKIETNIEYRYKLFGKLEGANFFDVGNIWAITKEEEAENPGALFRWKRFYNELAVGTGMGFRYDFSFFIFRADLGMKIHDPSFNKGNRWIFAPSRSLDISRDFNITLGIGYPF